MKHASLGPSKASRWLTCTASIAACEPYGRKTNSSADWGTACHAVGEQLLLGENAQVEGGVIEGVTIDAEMLDCAQDYVNYCMSMTQNTSLLMIEREFDLSFIAPNTFGTGDFSVLNGTHLDIVDLKTGHHIVDAENNPQLMLYALGAIHYLEEDELETIETVTLHIMQSRANHIDTWDTTVDELREFEAFAKEQATKILSGDTTFNPTKKACQWCEHAANCDALREHVDAVVTGDFDDLDELEGNADKVSTDHLKKIIDNADLILGFVKAAQQVALERMQGGEEIEGFKLVAGVTKRKWEDEAKVAKYLNRKIPAKELWVKKMIPMTQILKLRKGDKKLEAMLIKPEGKPTIAPTSDKRPALTAVTDCFDDLDEEL